MNESEKYTRRAALNKIRAVVMRESDDWVDNTRAGYWLDLEKIRDALKDLEFHQAYEENMPDRAREHNEQAEKSYKNW